MKILAVDLGLVRTGIALSDRQEMLASPLCVLQERNREVLAQKIGQLCQEHDAEHIVLGLPRNMDGSEGESAHNARAFASLLEEATGLPVVLRDERGTTITAHHYLNATDTRGKKRKQAVDAVAATIILQDYLDYRRNRL